MASNIDDTKPTSGNALTLDVRDNFTAAHDEIVALQTVKAPLASPTFTGTVTADVLTATGNVTFTTVVDGGAVTTVDINGGTVDATVIGGATPAAGDFTTLGATGASTLGGDTTVTGYITSEGAGAGVQGFVGKSLNDTLCFWYSLDSSDDAEHAWHVCDQFTIAPDILGTNTFATFSATEISLKTNNAAVLVCDTNGNALIRNIPTSSDGLASDTIWSDGGTLKIIP